MKVVTPEAVAFRWAVSRGIPSHSVYVEIPGVRVSTMTLSNSVVQ